MSTKFDGANDNIVCSAGAAMGGIRPPHTLATISKRNRNTAWDANGICFRSAPTVTQIATELNNFSPGLIQYGSDTDVETATAATQAVADGWCLNAVSQSDSNGTPLFVVGVIGPSSITWRSGPGATPLDDQWGIGTDIIFGEYGGGLDDFNGWLSTACWWEVGLSLAEIQGCLLNRRTSDFWNTPSARPRGLWEFNTSGPIQDLTGNGANETSRNGTTQDTGDDPTGWVYDAAAEAYFPATETSRSANVQLRKTARKSY